MRKDYFSLIGDQISDKGNHLKYNQLSNRSRVLKTREKITDFDGSVGQ